MSEDKTFTPIVGIITSLISWEVWQNIFLSFLLAFVGGVAAFIARKICSYFWNKYFIKAPVSNETKD